MPYDALDHFLDGDSPEGTGALPAPPQQIGPDAGGGALPPHQAAGIGQGSLPHPATPTPTHNLTAPEVIGDAAWAYDTYDLAKAAVMRHPIGMLVNLMMNTTDTAPPELDMVDPSVINR